VELTKGETRKVRQDECKTPEKSNQFTPVDQAYNEKPQTKTSLQKSIRTLVGRTGGQKREPQPKESICIIGALGEKKKTNEKRGRNLEKAFPPNSRHCSKRRRKNAGRRKKCEGEGPRPTLIKGPRGRREGQNLPTRELTKHGIKNRRLGPPKASKKAEIKEEPAA